MRDRDVSSPTRDFTPGPEAPAVASPALRRYVDAARSVPDPEPALRFEVLWAEARRRRRARSWRFGIAGVSAAAAVLLALRLFGGPEIGAATDPRGVMAHTPDETRSRGPLSSDRAAHAGAQAPRDAPPGEARPFTPAALGRGLHIYVEDEADPALVTGGHEAILGKGVYRAEVDGDAAGPLLLVLGREVRGEDARDARMIVLEHGVLEIDSSAEVAVARLVYGVAAWRDPGGAEVAIESSASRRVAPPPSASADEPSATPSAAQLARLAEAQLEQGDRAAAIVTLRRLTLRHGRSPEVRTGLLDLGRLLQASDRVDEARCAYALYLSRWPAGPLSTDVERSLRRLGEGPACRALTPEKP